MLALVFWVIAAVGACPSRSGDLQRPLGEAQVAFSAMDGAGFDQANQEVQTALACLSEPISPGLAAAIHRQEGLQAWLADDVTRARSAFRSALILQPAYTFPEAVAPPGNPLLTLYEEARGQGGGLDEPAYPEGGQTLLVDGTIATTIPSERPVVVQMLTPAGQVSSTRYLRPGEPMPPGLALQPTRLTLPNTPPDPTLPPRPPPSRPPPPRAGPSRPLLLGGVASIGVAAGSYAWSAVSARRYSTPGLATEDELAGLLLQNHLAFGLAVGAGTAGVALSISAFVAP